MIIFFFNCQIKRFGGLNTLKPLNIALNALFAIGIVGRSSF
jgi:hypothetical protein